MKKIPSLFVRDWDNNPRFVTTVVDEECQWVIDGEGRATIKWDGTAVMIRDGKQYKRYDVKEGRNVPDGFEQSQEPDETTGHWPGWIPVGDGPEDKWFRKGLEFSVNLCREIARHCQVALPFDLPNGTYELVGPKVNGNPHILDYHTLLLHGTNPLVDIPPISFLNIKAYLEAKYDIEGIVWHHSDGRMAKIKRTDFGFAWPSNG